jgi:urease accessory protein
MKTHRFLMPFLALLVAPSLAHAHVGLGEMSGFLHGFGHSLGGLDHLCAMIAVGLWAAQTGGRAIGAMPLAFVSVMALGGALGMMRIHLPLVEPGIILSVLILGVFIAAAVRLPLSASIVIIGLFALCHGHAHGAEMPETASGLAYAGGFVLTTSALHVSGIGLGIGIQKLVAARFVRFAGAAFAACGVGLWIG